MSKKGRGSNDRGKTGSAKQLWQQVEKMHRESNRGGISTRYTHRDKMSGFVDFVGERFHLQKFTNIADKHVLAYVEHAFQEGKSASTVWNTVSAVQYYASQFPGGTKLSDSSSLKAVYLERHPQVSKQDVQRHYMHTGKNPAWRDQEVQRAVNLARSMGREDVALAIRMGRELGLRIHEVTRQQRAALREALATGELTTKGKGGLIRDVPLRTAESRQVIEDALRRTSVDRQKAFVEHQGTTHKVIQSLESWIGRHRDKFADDDGRDLTFHGLRHAYAQREYEHDLRTNGGDERAARQHVAELLGHGRDWVTRIYLEESEK